MGATQKLSRRLATVRLFTTGETFAWVVLNYTACEAFCFVFVNSEMEQLDFSVRVKNAPCWALSVWEIKNFPY
jgi:hypothetical protein